MKVVLHRKRSEKSVLTDKLQLDNQSNAGNFGAVKTPTVETVALAFKWNAQVQFKS